MADVTEADGDIGLALGSAAAEYFSATLIGGDTVGISSWSASLLATVESMRPFRQPVVDTVVQLVGGLGDPRVQMRATRLIGQFASHTGAEPLMLSTPAVLDSSDTRDSLMADSTVASIRDAVMAHGRDPWYWRGRTLALLLVNLETPSPKMN